MDFLMNAQNMLNAIFVLIFQIAPCSSPALAGLVDKYLGHLYDSDHTKSILLSQARDVLVSGTYQGDLSSFETLFLREANKIATSCRNACLQTTSSKVSVYILIPFNNTYIFTPINLVVTFSKF